MIENLTREERNEIIEELKKPKHLATINMANKDIKKTKILGLIILGITCVLAILTLICATTNFWTLGAIIFPCASLLTLAFLTPIYFGKIKSLKNTRDLAVKTASHGKINYKQYLVIKDNIDYYGIEKEQSKEDKIFEVKHAFKMHRIFMLLQIIPCLLIIILFAFPFLKVNVLLTQVNVSIFDLVFSTSHSQSLKGFICSGLMADFFEMGEGYTNFFSGIYSEVTNFTSQDIGNNFISIAKGVLTFLKIFIIKIIPLGLSIVLIVMASIKSLIGLFKNLFSGNIEYALRKVDDSTFKETFFPKQEGAGDVDLDILPKFTRKLLEKPNKTLKKLRVRLFIQSIIMLAFYIYLPLRLTFFFADYPLVTVNVLFLILYAICVLVAFTFNIVEYVHGVKNGSLLHGGMMIKTTVKNVNKFN